MRRRLDELSVLAPSEAQSSPDDSVDLWCFFYSRADDASLLAAYDALMTEPERARHQRFAFASDRRLFLATRALVRTVLSHYATVRPQDWRFGERDHGKPYVVAPADVAPIHFNLSGTPGLAICAVSRAYADLGLDAECLSRHGDTAAIAESYFSPVEARALRALPASAQRDRFFSYWTLKESYIKARGLGLAIPLEQFSFLLDDGDDIGVTFDASLGDDATQWRFALIDAFADHRVAVGVNTGGKPLSLRAVNYVPLRGAVPWTASPRCRT